jgi:hypothetical protein
MGRRSLRYALSTGEYRDEPTTLRLDAVTYTNTWADARKTKMEFAVPSL